MNDLMILDKSTNMASSRMCKSGEILAEANSRPMRLAPVVQGRDLVFPFWATCERQIKGKQADELHEVHLRVENMNSVQWAGRC